MIEREKLEGFLRTDMHTARNYMGFLPGNPLGGYRTRSLLA
jgi:hypothetical protein